MNHCPECFLNWHGAFLGQGDLILFIDAQGHKCPVPERGQKVDIFFKIFWWSLGSHLFQPFFKSF